VQKTLREMRTQLMSTKLYSRNRFY